MSRDRGRDLNHEDRILWGRVAGSVTPLPGRSLPKMSADFPPEEDAPEQVPKRKIAATPPAKTPQPAGPPSPAALDRVTRRKIAKGRVPIEGKVDLHGLTQREAHGLLLSFLSQARAAGRRHVLVVTGKGSSMGSEGILRRAVPQWFATAAFRGLVSGYEDASRGHGGSGALYVRLRRIRDLEE
ncbi:MAG: Smr/MutS family protein [Mesorhizobium sp.]|nr:Smr/MutS family protein [Mesorhizobium sp.]